MGTQGYLERLKHNDQCSEVWWDSSPVIYAPYKKHLLDKYPAALAHIEQLMPDDISQPRGFSSVTTNPRLVTAALLDKREYWSSRFSLASLTPAELRKKLYNEVILEGAAALYTAVGIQLRPTAGSVRRSTPRTCAAASA